MIKKFLFFLLLIIVYLSGVYSFKYYSFPLSHIGELYYDWIGYKKDVKNIYSAYDFRETVSSKNINNDSTLVLLCLGQSNAANFGETKYECKNNVYNFYNNKLFPAKDPLIGSDGIFGSVWTRLGDKLIDNGLCKKVIIICLAKGNSSIEDWSKNKTYQKEINKAINQVKSLNINLDFILFCQGEEDNKKNTSQDDYLTGLNDLKSLFINQNISCPIFVSITSFNPKTFKNKNKGIDLNIQNAQKTFIKENQDVFVGPNTDEMTNIYQRHGEIHFSEQGMEELSLMWLNCIKKSEY